MGQDYKISRRWLRASQYNDPRGGRPSAIERNVLRYRSIEGTLYLFYNEELRSFMKNDVLPYAPRCKQGKELETAFKYAVHIGLCTSSESEDIQKLLIYRNDIAHRVHMITADVSRQYWNNDLLSFEKPTYKSDALSKLGKYLQQLKKRGFQNLPSSSLNMNSFIFREAEIFYKSELKRLDTLIKKQSKQEIERITKLNAEINLEGTDLVGEFSPFHPLNFRPCRTFRDDYYPPTGHLTQRGAEICYRLYDLNRSPLAVAYLMGITIRSAERRKISWINLGGSNRVRTTIETIANHSQLPA